MTHEETKAKILECLGSGIEKVDAGFDMGTAIFWYSQGSKGLDEAMNNLEIAKASAENAQANLSVHAGQLNRVKGNYMELIESIDKLKKDHQDELVSFHIRGREYERKQMNEAFASIETALSGAVLPLGYWWETKPEKVDDKFWNELKGLLERLRAIIR